MPQEVIRPKVKSADQSVVSSIVLVDDSELSFPIGANEKWDVELRIPFNLAGVASGARFAVNGPAAPTNVRLNAALYNGTGIIAVATITVFDAPLAGGLAAIGDFLAKIEGSVENGPNAGNLVFRFAQNVSSPAAITIKRGAVMKMTQVS